MTRTSEDLAKAVDRYCSLYAIEPAFKTSDLRHLRNDDWRKEAAIYGCYAAYSESRELIYVGKASFGSTILSRMRKYFRGSKDTFRVMWPGWRPVFIQFITVNKAYEAPSLEEYLIQELEPHVNKIGRVKQL